nr:hypothetical protein BaRGS_015485 [Batillaria attramentaria]
MDKVHKRKTDKCSRPCHQWMAEQRMGKTHRMFRRVFSISLGMMMMTTTATTTTMIVGLVVVVVVVVVVVMMMMMMMMMTTTTMTMTMMMMYPAAPWQKESLSEEEQKEWDDSFKLNSFNQFASDRISVHRTLQDSRPQVCKDRQYRTDLPPCNVVIIFHNEAWSVLLRSVHSLLDRTPPHLLTEIILVDDKSTMGHLGKPLEKYFKDYAKVRIVRSPERGGLTRARLIGFTASTADIVVFLDSHIECMSGGG